MFTNLAIDNDTISLRGLSVKGITALQLSQDELSMTLRVEPGIEAYFAPTETERKPFLPGAYARVEPAPVPLATPGRNTITRRTQAPISWAEIKKHVQAGIADKILSVGDEIEETLKTGEEVVFVVAGLNTYRKGEVIFSLKDALADSHSMNERNTNDGGWNASGMRAFLNSEILEALPDDLRAVIAPREIDGEESKLWLFSEYELFGENEYGDDDDDEHIPYYQKPINRVKARGKGGSANWWWERSPNTSNSASFCVVVSGGGANSVSASTSGGVCFGFCI